jgi:hypothetical protein
MHTVASSTQSQLIPRLDGDGQIHRLCFIASIATTSLLADQRVSAGIVMFEDYMCSWLCHASTPQTFRLEEAAAQS